jgi:hypothetical protein
MPELGSYGSVRGARGNSRPYRERHLLRLSSSQFDPKETRPPVLCQAIRVFGSHVAGRISYSVALGATWINKMILWDHRKCRQAIASAD